MTQMPAPSSQKYLNNFPQGNFTVNARFYRAECAYSAGEGTIALQDYDAVLAGPSNVFTENTLTKAAGLAFDAKEFGKALGYFPTDGNHGQYARQCIGRNHRNLKMPV